MAVKDFGPLQKVARAIAFGRHVPLSRIARRIALDLKRRVKQRGAKPAPAAAPSLSTRPPRRCSSRDLESSIFATAGRDLLSSVALAKRRNR
jgi:hypothetical protein